LSGKIYLGRASIRGRAALAIALRGRGAREGGGLTDVHAASRP
jgi:hypothetical protein